MEREIFLDKTIGKDRVPIWIIYGTHTGNCMQLAEEAAEEIRKQGKETKVCDMEDFDVEELKDIEKLLVIVSTDGEGDPPLMAEDLLEYLQSGDGPRLNHLSYSVLALGDTDYYDFCQAGKNFDTALEKLGAERIAERVDCDVDFEEDYTKWLNEILKKI